MPQEPSSVFADIFSVEGTRAIGEPTHIRIRFTHPSPALTRLDYVGKMAKFLIQPPHDPNRSLEPEKARGMHGIVTGFTHLSTNRDESSYELVLESRLALLRNAPKVRWFWDKSFVDVIVAVLKEHGFDQLRADVKVQLYRDYAKRAVIAQWEEDDLTFIQRLCRRAGIWFICGESDTVVDCEMIYFHDDFTHYRHDDRLSAPMLSEGGMNSDGAESIFSLETHTRSIPRSYTVRGYNYRKAPDAIEATSVIHNDSTTYGESYTYGLPVLTKEDAQAEALLRQEEALSQQVQYHGTTDMLDAMPGNVVKPSNRALADAKWGMVIVCAKFSAARKQPFKVEYRAIPSDRLYRMPLLEHTWPRMQGDISAVIASPNQYAQPFVTKDGEYVARIHADRDTRVKGMESCLLRLAKPFAGSHRTGFHYGLHDGTEVGIAGHLGNPELLYVAHVFHNSLNDDPSVATSQGFNVSAFRNVAIAARAKLSLFANTLGAKLIAAKGPVEIQAQSDVLALAAQKDVIVTSANGAVHVRADKELVLECGGAYVELKDGTITLGSASPLQLKLPGMTRQAPEIMHLAGPSFAPNVVPFKTACDAWMHGDSFADATTPAGAKMVNWQHSPSQAPAPDARGLPSSGDGLDADQNPKQEPTLPVTPDGQTPAVIKLESPSSCSWKLSAAEQICSGWTETGEYKWLDENKNPWVDANGKAFMGGGKLDYAFRLKLDSEAKCLTATLRVKIVPVDLLIADSSGNPVIKDGQTQSVPYDAIAHSTILKLGVNKPYNGLVIKHREDTKLDLAALKSEIEGKLNSHKGMLILDGCTRGAACGWRVRVRFEVQLEKDINGEMGGVSVDPKTLLFPKAHRATSGAWGEEVATTTEIGVGYVSALQTSVLVHECMHLFGGPDEYWQRGGFVHKQYITGEELDFERGKAMSGELTWQMYSANDLMGYGANSTSATVRPYYLEYVRQSFYEMTRKHWKIGYEGEV